MMSTNPRQGRYESLDLWRGFACLLVVLFHSSIYLASEGFDSRVRTDGGSLVDWAIVAAVRLWIGVPIFFVISGYCIAASAEAARSRPRGVGRYFARRAVRIYPPLWAAIGLAVAILLLLPAFAWPETTVEGFIPFESPDRLSASQWIGNLTLTESWRPALGGSDRAYALGQLWTLCYEEQFYLVVGILLLVARRWFFPGVWLVTGLVILNHIDLNALGARLGIDLNAYQIHVTGVFTDGLWLAFAAGVAVYYRLNHASPAMRALIECAVLALGVAMIRSEADPFSARQTMSKYIIVACAFALLLCRLHPFDSALASTRWTALLRFCGRMCYSLYLTHTLIVLPCAWMCYNAGLTTPTATVLFTMPVCALLAVSLGYVFHRAIEQRFLNKPASAPTDTRRTSDSTPRADERTRPATTGPGSSTDRPAPSPQSAADGTRHFAINVTP